MANLSVLELCPALGVEVRGLDVSGPVLDGEVEQLRRLFDRYHLLLFRGQQLDAGDHVRLCGYFGGVPDPASLVSNVEPGGFHPEFKLVFHSDYAFVPHPLQGISLYALRSPRAPPPPPSSATPMAPGPSQPASGNDSTGSR